jgi:hypothetical protein
MANWQILVQLMARSALETIVAKTQTYVGRSVVLLGRVDAGTTPAATNYQWVYSTSEWL